MSWFEPSVTKIPEEFPIVNITNVLNFVRKEPEVFLSNNRRNFESVSCTMYMASTSLIAVKVIKYMY